MNVVSNEANLRVSTLGSYPTGQLSPAYKSAMKRGKPFGTDSTNRTEIMTAYISAMNFLSLKTSTIAGWEETRERLEPFTKSMNNAQLSSFFDLFQRFYEANKGSGWDWSTVYKICYSLYESNQQLDDESMLALWQREIDGGSEFDDLNDDTFTAV